MPVYGVMVGIYFIPRTVRKLLHGRPRCQVVSLFFYTPYISGESYYFIIWIDYYAAVGCVRFYFRASSVLNRIFGKFGIWNIDVILFAIVVVVIEHLQFLDLVPESMMTTRPSRYFSLANLSGAIVDQKKCIPPKIFA